MQSLLLYYATKLRLFNCVFPTKLYFTPKVNYGTFHFVKFSSPKKYQKSSIFTIFYNIKLDKIVPSFSSLRKISFGGKTKVVQLGTIYPQSDTEHLTTLLTSKNFTIMKIYIMANKETRISSWANRVEVEGINTSFSYEKLLKVAEQYLSDLDEQWQVDLKKLTATNEDETSITKIEIIIKTIEI